MTRLAASATTAQERARRAPSSGDAEGVEGFIEYQLFVREAWSNLEISLDELIDVGPNRLLVLQRHAGQGRGSGVPLDWQLAVLYEYREGMLVAMTVWADREVAFRELGLPSPARG